MRTDRLQELVIRSSPWPPFRWGYAAVYGGALVWLMARLRRFREIRSLDLRPPGAGHCYGSSDLDLRAETVPLEAPAFFALADRLADVLLAGGTWLRIFDLYAFPQADYELQRRVVARSVARGGRRWVRLLGARPMPPEPASLGGDACLGRTTYDYAAMSQDLLQSDIDLHRTRLQYARVVRIDRELREQGAVPEDEGLAREVLDAARDPVLHGRVRRVPFATLSRVHALALAETTALARLLPASTPTSAAVIEPAVAERRPDTLDAALADCREAVAELCASLGGTIRSAILGGVPACRYEYRIYLIVRDGLSTDEHVALCAATRRLFVHTNARLGYAYFRLRYPLILTRTLWRAAARWYHALRPVEEHFFLMRHGRVLWGDDLRGELVAPDRAAVIESAAIAVADLRNRIWAAQYHRQPKQLADLIGGRIPALWLALARGRVATSPAAAIEACATEGFPHADALAALHDRLDGVAPRDLPPADDAVWRPTIAALTEWLELLPSLALASLGERHGGLADTGRLGAVDVSAARGIG